MRSRTLLLVFLVFLLSIPIGAQAPAVQAVGSPAVEKPSPGVVVRVFWTGLATVSGVRIGGRATPVLGVEPWIDDNDRQVGQVLSVQIPVDLPEGPAELTVTSGGVTSAPYILALDRYSPAFVQRTGYFFERVLSSGALEGYTCSPGGTLKAGDTAAAYAIGLGPTDPAIQTGAPAPASPIARALVKPALSIGGRFAEVLDVVLLPGEIGIYRITFKVPAGDGMHYAALGLGGKISRGVTLPVGNAIAVSGPDPAGAAITAPGSVLTAWACGGTLTTRVQQGEPLVVASGDGRNPPVSLAGTTAKVTDSRGVERPARLLYVSPNQVNYLIPEEAAAGRATVTIASGDGVVSTGALDIRTIAPQLFYHPFGFAPAGYVVRVRDGLQTVEPLVQNSRPAPIDLGPEGDQLFLVLFGTGWGSRITREDVRVLIASVAVPVEYAGPQFELAGLDQLNVRLPRSLAGRGVTGLDVNIGGHQAGSATLSFQ